MIIFQIMSLEEEYNLDYTDECLYPIYKDRYENRGSLKTEPLQTFTLGNGIVYPFSKTKGGGKYGRGGIADTNGKIFVPATIPQKIFKLYKLEDEIKNDSREVIYAGVFWEHWGHFILEQISRLYYFLNETDKSIPIIYIASKPLEGVYLEFLELLDIDISRLIWIDKPTRFKKIIIPEASIQVNNYYSYEYKKIIEKVKSSVPTSDKYDKVFYTRRNFQLSEHRDLGQIREIEHFFEKNGYKLISPEQLSLKEQISVMKGCKKFAAITGTLPHNLIFASENIEAVILNKTYIINYHQWLLDSIFKLKPIYIDAHLSIFPHQIGSGRFYFAFTQNLTNWANDNDMIIDNQDLSKDLDIYFKQYLNSYTILHNIINVRLPKNIMEYYLNQIKGNFLLKIFARLLNKYPHFIYKILKFIKK